MSERICRKGHPVPAYRFFCPECEDEPERSPYAQLFADHDNVSGAHATVGVDHDGRMWVRDDYSKNGTFVNEQEITPLIVQTIRPGDTVRLAADVTGQVAGGTLS